MLNAEWRSRPANNFFEFKKYSVLILDDHSSSQKIMTDVLRALGCRHIHRAATCNSAMAVLKAFTIDLLIADIALNKNMMRVIFQSLQIIQITRIS